MKSEQHGARVDAWLSEPMPEDVRRAIQRLARAPDVRRIAVMPDVHLAEDVCVGCVVATGRLLYPQAVGGDIGCGMAALAFDADADRLRDPEQSDQLRTEISRAIPALRHRALAGAPVLPRNLLDANGAAGALSTQHLLRAAERDGRIELGTLGRGNHFLEFQSDDDGRLWLMLHSGSRYMGQAITTWHLRQATAGAGGLATLDSESAAGRAYLSDMAWARAYADANRRLMLERACDVLCERFGIRPLSETLLLCDHNHVQRECHDGQEYWVHRKGAMRAGEGELGIIPGSMGTYSLHVIGRGRGEALCSSAHGAGRAMSRQQARRAISPRALRRQMEGVDYDQRAIRNLCDEAPAAYKNLDAVIRAQRPLVRIVPDCGRFGSTKGGKRSSVVGWGEPGNAKPARRDQKRGVRTADLPPWHGRAIGL